MNHQQFYLDTERCLHHHWVCCFGRKNHDTGATTAVGGVVGDLSQITDPAKKKEKN